MATKKEYLAALQKALGIDDTTSSDEWEPDKEEEPKKPPEPEREPPWKGKGKAPAPGSSAAASGYNKNRLIKMVENADPNLQEYMKLHQEKIAKDLSECLEE